uniref:uncharacterized protein LOC120337407 n=1 Tax=Styela clava TaxID=7725 RepID=UPI001939B594|nr:uncharacterized protein LOC120337407 [Styela clava]
MDKHPEVSGFSDPTPGQASSSQSGDAPPTSHINIYTGTEPKETSITGAVVQDMSIESAKDVSVISEHTEIASQKATVQTVEATLSAAEAHISAETLQQINITETSIIGAVVQDMSIESAKDVSVISEHTEIASQKATVQTVEASLSAAEAHISAETLQQINITGKPSSSHLHFNLQKSTKAGAQEPPQLVDPVYEVIPESPGFIKRAAGRVFKGNKAILGSRMLLIFIQLDQFLMRQIHTLTSESNSISTSGYWRLGLELNWHHLLAVGTDTPMTDYRYLSIRTIV